MIARAAQNKPVLKKNVLAVLGSRYSVERGLLHVDV